MLFLLWLHLFILSGVISPPRIPKWFAIPFSSVPHFVKLSTMIHLSLVALHGMAHSFIELDKVVIHMISLISYLWLWFSFCLVLGIRGLWKLSVRRDWLRVKLGLVLMGGAMLSKSLIQFSVDGQGCVPSLLFDLRPNYGGSNEGNDDLLQKVSCCAQCFWPCRPVLTLTSARDSWTLTSKSGSVSCEVTAPFLSVEYWVRIKAVNVKIQYFFTLPIYTM